MEINISNQEIRLVNISEKDIVVKIIMEAFKNDPHMNWLIEKSKNEDKLQIVSTYVVEETFNKGEIYLTKDNLGAALWYSKKKERLTFEYLKRNISFLFTMGITTVFRALKMANNSHSHFPKVGDFCYLYIIGVLPDGQGQGLASKLMNPVLEKCRNEKVPAFLETANPKNVEIYKKKGFELTDSLNINNNTTFYFMKFLE